MTLEDSLTQSAIELTAKSSEVQIDNCFDEYLQYRPLEQLSPSELQQLLDAEVVDYEELLDRPFDELTSEDWERLREYEPRLELTAA